MWRNLFIAAVICFVSSVAGADVVVTLDGDNLTDVIVMANYPGELIVAIEGNTPVGPNDISIEAQNGTLEPGEPNGGYYFRFITEGEAAVNLLTNVDMVIDGCSVPANTLIYQLWLCYNPDANIYAAFGIGLAELLTPPVEEEAAQGELLADELGEPLAVSVPEEPNEQFGTNTEETLIIEEATDLSNAEMYYDPTMDLNADGKIDFADFAILGAGWLTTYDIYDLNTMFHAWSTKDCCTDTNNIPDPCVNTNWQNIYFTPIISCPEWPCDEEESDPCNDNCGNRINRKCEETPDLGYICAFNYWFNGYIRIGLCVYDCGRNAFQVLKNNGSCRNLITRHRTRDVPPQDPCCFPNCNPVCDEGTTGRYNWQIVVYFTNTGYKTGYCRESVTDPNDKWGWQPWEGETGPCKYHWWPY